MGASCRESVALNIMMAVQILLAGFTVVVWIQHAAGRFDRVTVGDEATARCTNLLPDQRAAIVNGVYVPPGAIRSVPISRTRLTMTVQLVATGKPFNRALNMVYTVPLPPKPLLNAPRILFALELKSHCKSCHLRRHCRHYLLTL
jgi:hypothetical protein